jgi:hypothetical protein
MNTAGLTFSRLSSYYPEQRNPFTERLKITDEAHYLSAILHSCENVKEVREYVEDYDHSFFLNDVFIYIDNSGEYLIVEPYKLINGSDSNYILANFCPSITSIEQARELERFSNGEAFLTAHRAEATFGYCTALSDTMHVCRNRNGDGTLLTSIWDTKDKKVNLFFYHAYDTAVQFSLHDELAEGDHGFWIESLFPENAEFQRLKNFKTPSNSVGLRVSLVILAGMLFLFSLAFGVFGMRKLKLSAIPLKQAFLFSVLNGILIVYIAVLITNKGIFYFDVPYTHPSSWAISATSFTPFLLLAAFGPILFYTITLIKSQEKRAWLKVLLVSNSLTYFLLLIGFAYWGVFDFWS